MGKYRWIYIAAVVAAGVGFIATDRKQMLVLLLFLIALFCVSVICWAASLIHLEYGLEVEDVSIRGREISVKIVLKYPGIIPLGSILMDVEYENLIFSDTQHQRIVLKPGSKKRIEYLLPYISDNCGKTCVRIKRARIYDLLGIICFTERDEKEREVIIYPDVKKLEVKKTNVSNSKNFGEYYDETHKGQDVSEVFDMRDYQQGDNVKSIHWKLSWKLDKLVVREFGNPINYHTAIYYDMNTEESMSPEDRRDAQNGVLQMAASLSKSMAQSGFFHHMVTIENLKEQEILVQDNASYLQMLAEMMSRRIPVDQDEYLSQMEVFSQDSRFTNILLVCGALNMSIIRQLSRKSNLTVIFVNTNQEDSVEKGENFTIISVPVGKIDKSLQMIEF